MCRCVLGELANDDFELIETIVFDIESLQESIYFDGSIYIFHLFIDLDGIDEMLSGEFRIRDKLCRFGWTLWFNDRLGKLISKLVHVLDVNFFLLGASGEEYVVFRGADVIDQRGDFHVESGVGEVGTDFEFVDLPDLLIEFGRVDPTRNAFAVLFNLSVVAEGLVDLHLHGI